MNNLKSLFLLDPDIHFLNHGSFGACPRPVVEVYQTFQSRLEAQPVLFLGRELVTLEGQARQVLGAYLNAAADDLVFIPNATHGVNIVARSLAPGPGDEILTSDHEYGACDNTWDFICRKSGASYIHQPIALPIETPEAFVEQFWQGVTPRTKLIYLSHITSPTAQRFPIETICQCARATGILTLIDGAHAPGQIPLDMQAVGADFYTGNCHKWMLSPKGAAFLYTRREMQGLIEPLIVSWGYSADEKTTTGSRYIDLLQWTGTHDPSAALSVPAAIQFMQEHHWDEVRQHCYQLLRQALRRIDEITGLPSAYAYGPGLIPQPLPPQMGVAYLPYDQDLTILKSRLYDEYHIEAPLILWNDQKMIRLSIQGYNTQSDVDALIIALQQLLPGNLHDTGT
jgi:isopenicillin-N epimerase